jgi:hypothetical protein
MREARARLRPERYGDFKEWCKLTEGLFSLDDTMIQKEVNQDLKVLKTAIFGNRIGVPLAEYDALVAAARHKQVNLKSDLLKICMSDILGDKTDNGIDDLFELYGESITQQEFNDLVQFWAKRPSRQAAIEQRRPFHGNGK